MAPIIPGTMHAFMDHTCIIELFVSTGRMTPRSSSSPRHAISQTENTHLLLRLSRVPGMHVNSTNRNMLVCCLPQQLYGTAVVPFHTANADDVSVFSKNA